jgi:hypothetical protein
MLGAWVLVLLGFASPCIAQRGGHAATGGEGDPMTVRSTGMGTAGSNYAGFRYGVVKSIGGNEIVLTKTDAGLDETFKLNKKTKFVHDGKSSSPDSVKVGDKVWVDAHVDKKTGDSTARKVVSGTSIM